ncbi:MAG: hypothetical protein K9N38_01135 [Candidatus Marinimicrobia bacterium]|nr:hypothetical protein [Candidatus Neomarinimicrobiota bacterium]MCF7850029.1 hypothetical protein [Candidatus Neomarinimicrobiota bacterium]
MKQRVLNILILSTILFTGSALANDANNCMNILPKGIYSELSKIGWFAEYELCTEVNPMYQRGDFNGDGAIDFAVQIRAKKTGKRGILIMHANDSFLHVIGAGVKMGDLGDNFDWLNQWKIDSYTVRRSRYGSSVEALVLNHPTHPGTLVFWDGKGYIAHELEAYYYYSDSIHITQSLDSDLAANLP